MKGWSAIGAAVAVEIIVLPSVLALYHTFKLFFCFARGEVFAAKPIAHIRAAGLWLTVSFFTGVAAVYLLEMCGVKNFGVRHHFPGSLPGILIRFQGAMFTGVATIIAAYVMAEAHRIADENASIL